MKLLKSFIAGGWYTAVLLWILTTAAETPYAYHITLTSIPVLLALYKMSYERYGNDTIDVRFKYHIINTIKQKTDYIKPVFVCFNLLRVGTNAGRLTDHLDTKFYRNRIRRVY